jgi:hypothetical protein
MLVDVIRLCGLPIHMPQTVVYNLSFRHPAAVFVNGQFADALFGLRSSIAYADAFGQRRWLRLAEMLALDRLLPRAKAVDCGVGRACAAGGSANALLAELRRALRDLHEPSASSADPGPVANAATDRGTRGISQNGSFRGAGCQPALRASRIRTHAGFLLR